jgi:microcystin-dependent protein
MAPPYDGSGVWSPPAGTAAVSGATVASAKFNSVVADIQAALNDLRYQNLNVAATMKTLLGSADMAAARTNLGLAIGTNVQAYDPELAALAGLASAADQLPYFTGAGAAALTTLSAFGRTLIDDADAATMRGTLGLGALSTLASVATANVDNDAITYAKMQNISATARFLGRFTAGSGDAEEVTGTQATTLLDVFTSGLKGLVPASGGGTTTFLRADGAFAAPGGGIPAGVVVPYAASAAPSGWLLCFGQAVSRTTEAALFAVIGTTYGVGDGSTTFNLPDLRGRVVAGEDDMGGTSANRLTGLSGGVDGDILGGSGGSESHTLTTAQLAVHNHTITFSGSGAAGSNGAEPNRLTVNNITSSNAGSGSAHNNVQPTLILTYIIKT